MTFDLTNKVSFDNVEGWLKSIRQKCPEDMPLVLVGNKIDLINKQDEMFKEVDALAEHQAKQQRMPYFKTSAQDGTNVNEMCMTIFDAVFQHKIKPELSNSEQ